MPEQELIRVYNDDIQEIGVATRSEVHQKGLLHQVVHCWLIDDGLEDPRLFLQQRSLDKDSFPGWYDIAVAGHVAADEDARSAVVRECQEELGLNIDECRLEFIGVFRERYDANAFHDNELCHAYIYPVTDEGFSLGNEVQQVVKLSVKEFEGFLVGSVQLSATVVGESQVIDIDTGNVFRHDTEYLLSVLTYIRGRQMGIQGLGE